MTRMKTNKRPSAAKLAARGVEKFFVEIPQEPEALFDGNMFLCGQDFERLFDEVGTVVEREWIAQHRPIDEDSDDAVREMLGRECG